MKQKTPQVRDPALKVWTVEALKREDWDFKPLLDWPDVDLKRAWILELERKLGSTHGPCVLSITPNPAPAPPMLKSYSFAELEAYLQPGTAWIPSGANAHTTIQPIEIDWTQSETETVEAFRRWLRDGAHPFHTSFEDHARHLAGKKRGKRKTEGFRSWLRELSIYRLSECGYTRAQGLAMIGGGMSAANWEHAQARARGKILAHLKGLRVSARNMARVDPARSSPDWKDYLSPL